MVQLGFRAGLVALARNQAHRFIGARRGGHRTSAWSAADRQRHCRQIFDTLAPSVGGLAGKVGLEIGPGDNLGVCELFLQHGCRSMIALEKFAHPAPSSTDVTLLRQHVEELALSEPIDFAISNDVLEHVDDIGLTMRRVHASLKRGGLFVSSVDLRGHNMFNDPTQPLGHLTAPNWLYSLLTSHIETSNRVRCSELVSAAINAGFEVVRCEPLATADRRYLHAVRPHLRPRYRTLEDRDLEVLQLLLVLRK